MPNWCNNTIEIRHEDPAMIQRAAKALADGTFLEEFIPVPLCLKETIAGSYGDPDKQAALEKSEQDNLNAHNYKNWYDFCVNEWGTKWDVQSDTVEITDPHSIVAGFDSAWAPPIAAYEKLVEMGFQIKAMYYEPGMAFAGIWEDGCDDYYEYGGMDSGEIEANLPKELDECFCISEQVAEWEAENQDE